MIVFVFDDLAISIHALREEGDDAVLLDQPLDSDFYPRPPRGGRLAGAVFVVIAKGFLSTPSARRATVAGICRVECCVISIHALREEGDDVPSVWMTWYGYFYPRPPRGGRPIQFGSRAGS